MNSNAFHIMAKPIGPTCNLDCRYCFYLDKEYLYPDVSNWKMQIDILENFTRQFIESQDIPEITFAWQGGEPALMGIDFFKCAIELQKKYADGKKILNSFQTNGTMLDKQWCELFKENNFLLGLSIDGPEEIHNRMRVTKNGQGSFDQVMSGLELLKKYEVEFNTLTCLHKYNSSQGLEIYKFLKAIGSKFMQFIPIVEQIAYDEKLKIAHPKNRSESKIAEWSVDALVYGKFLSTVFDEWVRADVGQCYVQIFDVALEAWIGMKPNLCIFSPTCGDALALEHNGDLYSCDHYVFPENKIGNITDQEISTLVNSDQQRNFGLDKKDLLPNYCKECDYLFACNGGCPKDRIIDSPSGERSLNYLCKGYKHFFSHIDPYMQFMANELKNNRAPANVMQWAKEKDNGFPSYIVGRNDPCPCGSGKKYKFCCGK